MRLPVLAAASLLAAVGGASALTATSSVSWKDGAAVADSWTMGQPATPQTYKYALTAGTGVTEGTSGAEAVFLTAELAPQLRYLERHIPLTEWRGKRLRVALRMKNQDKARGYAAFTVVNSDGSRLAPRSGNTMTGPHQDVWDTEQFVLDVPANAQELIVHASLQGPGTVWIDRLTLAAAGRDVDTDAVRTIQAPPQGTEASPPAFVPPGENAVKLAGDWHDKRGFRGAAVSWLMGSSARIRLDSGKGEGGAASLSGDAAVRTSNPSAEPQMAFAAFGGLESDVDLDSWRGKRVRLTLRLKNVDGARAYALAQVNQSDGDGARTLAQRNAPGSGGWETHQFVLDVPRGANHLYVYAGLTGKGAVLVDGLTLEAVDKSVPVSPGNAISAGGGAQSIYGGDYGGCLTGNCISYVSHPNGYYGGNGNDGSGYNPPNFPLQQTTSPNQSVSSFEQGQRR